MFEASGGPVRRHQILHPPPDFLDRIQLRVVLGEKQELEAVKEHQYVEAVQALGASRRRVVLQHIIPNIMAPYLIMLTAQLGAAILAEAALSYLGLGTAEPTPSWGLMLSGSASSYAEKAPWIALFPGIAISLGVFGFNLFGDSLRDALDPKLRRG
jgi:peptide/nickel transport system permease protein